MVKFCNFAILQKDHCGHTKRESVKKISTIKGKCPLSSDPRGPVLRLGVMTIQNFFKIKMLTPLMSSKN